MPGGFSIPKQCVFLNEKNFERKQFRNAAHCDGLRSAFEKLAQLIPRFFMDQSNEKATLRKILSKIPKRREPRDTAELRGHHGIGVLVPRGARAQKHEILQSVVLDPVDRVGRDGDRIPA
jgi:hypothetical protein